MADVDESILRMLVAKRESLEAEMATIRGDAKSAAGGISFGKRVGEGTNLAVERLTEVAIHDRLRLEYKTVRKAEAKAKAGTYGTCDGCKKQIPPARMEVLPWSTTCVNCADF